MGFHVPLVNTLIKSLINSQKWATLAVLLGGHTLHPWRSLSSFLPACFSSQTQHTQSPPPLSPVPCFSAILALCPAVAVIVMLYKGKRVLFQSCLALPLILMFLSYQTQHQEDPKVLYVSFLLSLSSFLPRQTIERLLF